MKKTAWGLQTVYLPRENIDYIEEWLAYHTFLGADFFFLYDNTGSQRIKNGNSLITNSKNKHGQLIDFSRSDDEIYDLEMKIFSKYAVTKVKWQPIENGQITYGQVLACEDFSARLPNVWCAFIDIDEFLLPQKSMEDFTTGNPKKILQKKFPDRWLRRHALDDTRTYSINTERWAPKILMNTSDYRPGGKDIHNLGSASPLEICSMEELRFNHYNQVDFDINNTFLKRVDPEWKRRPPKKLFVENCDRAKVLASKIDYASFIQTNPPPLQPVPPIPSWIEDLFWRLKY
jgi:hypothetical protein